MRKTIFLFLAGCSFFASGQTGKDYPEPAIMSPEMTEYWTPQPLIVTPGETVSDQILVQPPSDAIVLFNGVDLSQWEGVPKKNEVPPVTERSELKNSPGVEAKWIIENGTLVVNKEAGDIQTKLTFGDFQLHIEWCVPKDIEGESQQRGNSGVFLQGIYEIQVLDSYQNETYVNGQAGSIYKQTPPLVNAMRKPGEWNTYDIIYMAPTFRKDGTYRTRPRVTVLQNGILIQNNTLVLGTTPYIGLPKVTPHEKGPIRLQAHGDKSIPISFRNIWIREL